jgi:hypothetical protein
MGNPLGRTQFLEMLGATGAVAATAAAHGGDQVREHVEGILLLRRQPSPVQAPFDHRDGLVDFDVGAERAEGSCRISAK